MTAASFLTSNLIKLFSDREKEIYTEYKTTFAQHEHCGLVLNTAKPPCEKNSD